MIDRFLADKVIKVSKKFPAVSVTGPRQSGKTTLIRALFPKKPYLSFENPDIRLQALEDPRAFLSQYASGAVLDEVQRVPEIFSYLQEMCDASPKTGRFILTGSHQFLLMEKISQSLAGRVGVLKLLPLSLSEIMADRNITDDPWSILWKGFYPAIYAKNIKPYDWYSSYLETYLERDVRLIKNVTDLGAFQKFIKLCAARTGQVLNLHSLAVDCGLSHNTAKSWISLLEASYVVYLIQPYHENYSKRLIKAPKMYFYDTGLACHMLGIDNRSDLELSSKRGDIFETFVMSELIKNRMNQGLRVDFYYWRDKTGREIDCVYENHGKSYALEIKSAQTLNKEFFDHFDYLDKIAPQVFKTSLVFAGKMNTVFGKHDVIGWKNVDKIIP